MKRMMMAAAAVLLAGCATAPKERNSLNIVVGPDGRMTASVPPGASADDIAMAALMTQALNGDLDDEEAPQRALTEGEIWRQDGGGHLTHIQSGANCPATWSGMTRDRTSLFRADGMDVGCNYLAPNSPTVMTFYVFTSLNGGIEPEMKIAIDQMTGRIPVAKETPFSAPSVNGTYRSHTLAYDNADGTPMRTTVLLAQEGTWLLKIRLTCRASDMREAEQTAGLAILGQAERLRTKPKPQGAKPDPI